MVACGQVYGDIVRIDSIDWGGATFPLWMLPSPGFGFLMCKCEEEADRKERGVHSFLSTLDHGWLLPWLPQGSPRSQNSEFKQTLSPLNMWDYPRCPRWKLFQSIYFVLTKLMKSMLFIYLTCLLIFMLDHQGPGSTKMRLVNTCWISIG